MRIVLSALLLLVLIVPCVASLAGSSDWDASSFPALHLYKRQEARTAKNLLKAEVPERLKTWSIFRDGSLLREKIRTSYIRFLRQIDKAREPYSFSRGIKKEWIYKPDLRKHYMVPRVLRIPAILQQGPVRYQDEFAAYVKSADEELKLKEAARPHVPELAEESGSAKSGGQSTQRSGSEAFQPSQPSPLRPGRRRRRSRSFQSKGSFNQFQSIPQRDPSLPPTPPPESESDGQAHDGLQPSMSPIDERSSELRTTPATPDAEQRDSQASPVKRLSSELISMAERFEAFKKFQGEQVSKAAMRYAGHPQYHPSGQPAAAAERAGLAPIRTKVSQSQEVSPDPTPRRMDDPTGMDADVSNPQTPRSRNPFYVAITHVENMPDTPPFYPGSPYTPHVRTSAGDPSPFISPAGLTPSGSRSSAGAGTPGGFRLPPDYADLLHAARRRKQLQYQYKVPSMDPVIQVQKPEIIASPRVSAGWDDGRPSHEGIRRVQELAELNDAGYAIYNDAPDGHKTMPFSKLNPSSGEGGDSLAYVADKAQNADPTGGAPLPGRRDQGLLSASRGRPGFALAAPRPKSATHDIGVEGQETAPAPPQTDAAFRQAIPKPEAKIDAADDARSSPPTPDRKRKRPSALNKPVFDTQSFFFPDSQAELATPQLKNFKPSLSIQEDPNPQHDPTDPSSSPGLVFRRQGLMQLMHSSSAHLRSLQDRFKLLSPKGTTKESIIKAFQDRFPQRRNDVGDQRNAIFTR